MPKKVLIQYELCPSYQKNFLKNAILLNLRGSEKWCYVRFKKSLWEIYYQNGRSFSSVLELDPEIDFIKEDEMNEHCMFMMDRTSFAKGRVAYLIKIR